MRSSLLLIALSCIAPRLTADESEFTSTVEPILRKHCYECHSHAARELNGGLSLDSRSGWEHGGDSGSAIVPGDTANSVLMQRLRSADADIRMPPTEPLAPEEISAIERWIQNGAADPRVLESKPSDNDWWSLRPLNSPTLPADGHPIDAFINAALQRAEIAPMPAADRRTLTRRATVDLHGLLPSPEEVASFEADDSVDAWPRVIDRLLASPRYGERWARHWLDTIHYADSHGFEHDEIRPTAWKFRDYVITAFNQDLPWSDFVRQQLAADVVYPNQPELTPALGFLGAGTYDRSAAGTAPMSFEYLDRDDLVTQTMSAFVSTTANCARCHAHKFDPISQEDYFAIQAVFAGIGKGEISFDADQTTATKRQRWTQLIAAANARDAAILMSPNNLALTREWEAAREAVAEWFVLEPDTFLSLDGSNLERLDDGSIRSSGPRPETETIVVTANVDVPPSQPIKAIRLELLPDDSLPMRGPGRQDNGNVHVSEVEVQLYSSGSSQPAKITLQNATSDFDQAGFPATAAIDGNAASSWAIHPAVGQAHEAVFEFSAPVVLTEESSISVTLRAMQGGGHLLGRFRLSLTSDAATLTRPLPETVAAVVRTPVGERTDEQTLDLSAFALRQRAESEIAELPPMETVWAAGRTATNERGQITMERPRSIHLLRRGELDKPLQEVAPGSLSAIAELSSRFDLPSDHNESLRRLALADWIADPRNPLTWRSVVNRVWHYHFGKGLCDSPSDFGRMGGTPSHAELLDWLACWFRDEARGSLKQLHRLIMTSDAWQRSSAADERGIAIDPDRRLLWSMPRSRLDADTCHDAVLQVSGRMDFTPGGPGVQHFTTTPGPQVTPVLHYDQFDLTSAAAARRSIYRVVVRGVPDPFYDALDFPELGLPAPIRGFSASSLQSLTLFNNRFVLHHCDVIAGRLQAVTEVRDDQIRQLFQLCLQRDPDPNELASFTELASSHGLQNACRVMVNSNEFLFVD